VTSLFRSARGLALVLSLASFSAQAQGLGDAEPVVTTLTLFAGSASGLWVSSNWGGDWELESGAASGAALDGIGAVHHIFLTTTNVYIAADKGLFFSTDFGRSWAPTGYDSIALSVLPSRYPDADPTIFIATPGGLLKSQDGGHTFGPTPLQDQAVYRMEWPGPELVVATERGVSISADSAETFKPAGRGLPEAPIHSMTLSSLWGLDPVILAGGESGVYRSRDGGKNWHEAGLSGHTVNDLFWFGPLLYAATDQGLFRSLDAGDSWAPLGRGLDGVEPLRLMFPRYPESGTELFLATTAGIYRSMDGGARWQPSGLLDERVLAIATFPPPQIAEPMKAK